MPVSKVPSKVCIIGLDSPVPSEPYKRAQEGKLPQLKNSGEQ
jgi:hypothetical protein